MIKELVSAAEGITESVIGDKIKDKTVEIIDEKFIDPRLFKDIEEMLLTRFGTEPFYNDLTKYLEQFHVIKHTLNMFNGESSIESKDKYVSDNVNKFKIIYESYLSSDLNEVFSSIYEQAYREKILLNTHSDLGKLQQDLHRFEDRQMTNSNSQTDLLKLIIANQEKMIAQISNNNTVPTDDIDCTTEKIENFLEKIKNVSKNNLTRNDEYSITEYTKLLADVPTELRGENQLHIEKVICNIKCHMALCYSNLGKIDESLKQFADIQPNIAQHSKLYHLANAMIVLNHCIKEKYANAKLNIEEALKLDPHYHRAVFLKCYLAALQKEDTATEIINSLDSYFKPIIDKEADKSVIADYYVYRAFIYSEYDKHFDAIENHKLAIQYGYDEMAANYNIARSYYLFAVQNVPKDTRTFGIEVKHFEIIKVINILKSCLFNNNYEFNNTFLASRIIELYVSSCGLIGIKHKLNPIDKYISMPQLSYECVRGIILGSDGIISDTSIELLDDDDKLFAKVFNCSIRNDYNSIKKLFSEMNEEVLNKLPQGLIYMLLQTCVISKDTINYWKYRPLITNANNELIECLDAYSYELEGSIDVAKKIINKYASESKDYHTLSNILNFYFRNNLNSEHEELLLRIFDLKSKNEIYIDDIFQFYGQAISFLTKNKSYKAEKFIDELGCENLPIADICKIKWNYYNAIGDVLNMYKCIDIICKEINNFEDQFNKVICEIKLMKYSDALTNSLVLFNSLGDEKSREKVKMMCIISDIYLFMNDNDNSFNWARKAHEFTKQNPYDDSHQFFMGRAVRTGHMEALADTVEYKQTHPVIVGKWLKEFKISDKENPAESLINAIEEMSGESHNEYIKKEEEIAGIYRSNPISNYLLLKHYHQSLSNFFIFASKYKLSIYPGDVKQLESEKLIIKEDVFVDALTLIIMKRYNCLETLNNIKNIHICYSTISYLQGFIGGMDAVYVIDALKWIEESENIILESDGYKFDSISSEYFSEEFFSCCNKAAISQIPLLSVEPVVKMIQQHKLEILPEGLETISLPGFFYKIFENKPQQLSNALYDLLSECRFICFRADTILFIIKSQNYDIDKNALKRFFICDTTCDMISFANVYCTVISELLKENRNAAVNFTGLVLNDAIKIWRKGYYYRYILETKFPEDAECLNKSESIKRYLIYLTFVIKRIYADIPNEILEIYNNIIKIIAKNISHDFIEKTEKALELI